MSKKSSNVFISHHSKDDMHIGKMRELLARGGYSIKNSSVDSSRWNRATDEGYIRRLLRMRINWSGTCIVLLSDTTHSREWVNWEIETANRLGKRIIGVHCLGSTGCELPEALKKYGNAIVGWQSDRIIGAINGTINNFEEPDGSSSDALFSSSSVVC
ncbi:TIR domain-containing protein [Neolewinella lacunae]|uniref:TIR domain-containing protein n=1 Tax=Neolewinella lacunae TaxID=1517758 RepID=A0A923TA81_9BACT|nr:TIR domain-containing protein [Neolewinella lacunae]MBC6995878.1 TIR domain-containing protein [Neolewinella lacunae]MDN3636430.1 TIR domain-containing protein [Neolewinella lacunae]